MRNPHGKRRPIGENRSGGATTPRPKGPAQGQMAAVSNREAIVIRGKTDDDPGRRVIVPWHRSRYSPKPGESVGPAKR